MSFRAFVTLVLRRQPENLLEAPDQVLILDTCPELEVIRNGLDDTLIRNQDAEFAITLHDVHFTYLAARIIINQREPLHWIVNRYTKRKDAATDIVAALAPVIAAHAEKPGRAVALTTNMKRSGCYNPDMRRMRVITALLTVLTVASIVSAPVAVVASKPSQSSKTSPTITTGNDISWPQCNKLRSLPSGQAFGIVGVTGGRANTTNPCFSQELTWANKSTGKTAQPKVAFYVNTGNPGDYTPAVADWPSSNVDIVDARFNDTDPYGSCTGANDAACAWQYGYNMAHSDITYRGVANPMNYRWYLDVETGNSWSTNLANNAADLEGMVNFFESVNVTVGLYSTSLQWGQIVGTSYGNAPDIGGNNLKGLMSWLPGAGSQSSAKQYCTQPPLTAGGHVELAQYVAGQFDYDVSCS